MPEVEPTEQMNATPKELSTKELIALIATLMTLTALAIDLALPAFDEIRAEFGLPPDSPETAGLITVFLLGVAVPQIIYGPLADRFGRKPLLFAGLGLYVIGAVGSALSTSLDMMLVSRFVWGLGAAGPRVLTLSVIRDTFEGDRMARAMSFIMAVFIIVPILGPSIGAGLIAIAPWRIVYWFCVLYAGAVGLWVLRLPETLHPEHRLESQIRALFAAIRKVLSTRQTMGYAIALTALSGAFMSYIASSERIFENVFDLGRQFPFIFGAIAVVFGMMFLANGFMVGRLGARRMTHIVLAAYPFIALSLLTVALATDGRPGFWPFVILLSIQMAFHSLLLPNLNTLALASSGEVAGTASAVVGAMSTAGGAVLGRFIDQAFDGTVIPLAIAFLGASVAALFVIRVTLSGKLYFGPRSPAEIAAIVPPPIE